MTGKIIATDYVSLDGVIEDPVGMENSDLGDWTGPFTRGPEGDRFKLEELMNTEALIFGCVTYPVLLRCGRWSRMTKALPIA